MRRVGDVYIHPVPSDAGDFFISGCGYLCARTPLRMCLSEVPLTDFGITTNDQIEGGASPDQCAKAGILPGEGYIGLVLRPN